MQNKFESDEITARAYDYLKEKLSYKYVTIRHYKSRWRPVQAYMDKHSLKFINPEICKNFLLDLYKGRYH